MYIVETRQKIGSLVRSWTLKTVMGVVGDFASNPKKIWKAERARNRASHFQASGDFVKAAEAYAECLYYHPRRRGIWVQRGNCLKDCGDYDGARFAYDRALSLNDSEPDLFVQLGHLAEAKDDRELSEFYYSKALEIKSRYLDSLNYFYKIKPLKYQMGVNVKCNIPDSRVYALDITDLLFFLQNSSRVTGIQRVQCSLFRELLSTNCGVEIFAVSLGDFNGQMRLIDKHKILDLLKSISAGSVSQREISRKIDRITCCSLHVSLKRNDVFVSIGAFWNIRGYSRVLSALKHGGVVLGVYIYDVIPITHPHFFVANTHKDFIYGFDATMPLFDFGLAISEYTAKQAAKLVKERLGRRLHFRAVPLAHELPRVHESITSSKMSVNLPEQFVLCVCTIEIRKNHMLLVEIWSRMLEKHGLSIPSLIFVGKIGWKVEELMQRLSASNNIGGKIIIIQDASDSDLSKLYKKCLFTVFPSFAEGWGLPVGESLSYGKPCIASNSTSIPEVGGDLLHYIDPFDVDGAEAQVERAIFDNVYLDNWTQQIKDNFVMRRWKEVSQNFLLQIEGALALRELRVGEELVQHDSAPSIL